MSRLDNATYVALRIVTGFLFLFHGAQKILGYFTTKPSPAAFSQMWFGGIIELVGGALIMIGLLTRPVAFLCAGTMAVAYFQFHWKLEMGAAILPIVNGGELSVLYCFVFLLFAVKGAGPLSVDRILGRA